MNYGVLIRESSGQTIIDDSNPYIRIAVSGTYGVQTTNEAIVNCPSAIQSPYKPYVYFRPNGSHQIYLFRHIGSPGDWTRLAFRQSIYRDMDPPIYSGKWRASAVILPKTGGWGMQTFDTQPRVMFDSNRNIVRYLGDVQVRNKYAYNPDWPSGLML